MPRQPQKRRLETRAKLLEVTAELVATEGYSGLKVEDVVNRAGVAKGTLFSHFRDKDGLLAVLIGAEVMRHLDQMEEKGAPDSREALLERIAPLLEYVAGDRVIFDLLLRYSGSTGTETDEVVTEGFYRQIAIWGDWIAQLQQAGLVRDDYPAQFLAEGIQAFLNQVIAIWFCMSSPNEQTPLDALRPFLEAWLAPQA
ncbi:MULTISPECIES: TetR/AcrR family transcriptional regulator [Rhodobacterales]|uniref:TetR/AcrR family transcriptional regulator n=1 Tax=Rhodobacterales TaxID=204455 RepID=UPI00237F6B20|nr:TetR/AcrR family transcriptional regulator [Phaeobacter gallaeciensis]MDE4190126.1 TetR/AcrR family transcriptional regulator [Phaeobacter gallaeciensis]MDE4198381.1 TetR/AcrR family transcriptional regulator [Phaeobacter gallaeciensis]MDE4202526.1 TetR/AcrR family transcriptional regulator [Phaeobacter gallaeciensis]MDE4206178.1 TetR/AcrR family transcriptional regulator [Phaeobacter gallaeciensis]MDE4214545.1 TetR/AcrR family transcriptional regulator [Phaeobacter gallaeciensis]